MLKIPLETINRSPYGELFVANRKRLATATGVKFLNNSYLVATHLVGMKLYLIKYSWEDQTFEIVSSVDTVFDDEITITDLIDFNGEDLLAVSNFDQKSATLYRLNSENNHLWAGISHFQDVIIPKKTRGKCHGAKFHSPGILCLTTQNGWIHFIRIADGKEVYAFKIPDDPKDICFSRENRIIVLFNRGGNPGKKNRSKYNSGLIHLSLNLEQKKNRVLDTIIVKGAHCDSLTLADQKIYVTDQHGDRILVFRIRMDGKRLKRENSLSGDQYSFPHGIDYYLEKNLLAVSNYGTNQVILQQA